MVTFTLNSFTDGSLGALVAAQRARGSVPEWRLSNMNTAMLDIGTITPVEVVAPVGIWFEATNLQRFNVSKPSGGERYDPTAHEITYIWDFDDSGTFGSHLNVPTAWKNSGIDFGKKVYHVFDTPGTYAVRLWAIDRQGVVGERMISISVADPDVVFSGTRTICVSQESNFTDAPSGAQQVKSISAAQGAYNALGQSGRVLLRRGESFEGNYRISGSDDIYIGAFGPSEDARPVWSIVTPVAGASGGGTILAYENSAQNAYTCIHDIVFQGDWDAATETGDGTAGTINFLSHYKLQDWHATIYRCDIDGFGTNLEPGSIDVRFLCAIVDCRIENFQYYGVFVQAVDRNGLGSKIAMVGCNVASAENACEGGYGRVGLANEQGPVRFSCVEDVFISSCYFYSASSWAGSVQPCLRFQEDVTPVPDSRIYFNNVNRMVCEGGDGLFGLNDAGDGTVSGSYRPAIPGNYIFDMILLVGAYSTNRFFRVSYGGTTIRNGYCILPGMGRTVGAPSSFMDFEEQDPTFGGADNSTFPMRVYNCTFFNDTNLTFPLDINRGDFSDIVIENNVHHAPNAGVTTDAPVDLTQTISGFTPRNKGRRRGPTVQTVTVSSVGNGGTFTIAYPEDGFGNTLGSSDFVTDGRHTIKIGDARWYSYRGHFTVFLGASEIIVTNTSDAVMNGSVQMKMERLNPTTDATYASPSSVVLPVPLVGSNALVNDGGTLAFLRFNAVERALAPWKGAI